MKTTKKIIIFSAALFLCCMNIIAEPSLDNLLQGYLENDLSLQNLSASYKKQVLNAESTQIQNGINVKLSTGNINLRFSEDSIAVSVKPEVSVSLPQFNNLSVSGSSNVSIAEENKVSDTSIKVSADIYSSSSDKRNITLLKSERQVLEARRSLENRILEAEKEFYNELKTLYELALKVKTEEKTLYEDKITFDQIVAQGYSTSSAKYKTAKLTVLSGERNVENAKHKFERQVRIFASKCGVEYNYSDPSDFLPASIPSVESVDVTKFDKDSYKSVESAKWTSYINGLTRDADKAISVSANAGYTINDSSAGVQGADVNSVSVGANLKINNTGLVVGSTVGVPLGEDTKPYATLSLSFDPSAFRTASIDNEIDLLDVEQEEINLKKAYQSYTTDVISKQTELSDLKWSQSKDKENYAMYKTLAEEQLANYKSGIITESEYRSATVNAEKARVQCLIDEIDLIIYNDSTLLLFVLDDAKDSTQKEQE